MHAPVLLLPWAISLGSTIFAIGSEAHDFGLARSLPTSATALMIGKYAAYAIPTVVISLATGLISLAISPGNPIDGLVLLLLVIWLACATCAVDLAMSAAAPRFGREPVQRSAPFLTRVVAGASGLVMGALVVFGFALSPIGAGSIGAAMQTDPLTLGTGGWVLALAIALFAPITMMVMGIRRAAILLAGT
jgi:hypothetical protein